MLRVSQSDITTLPTSGERGGVCGPRMTATSLWRPGQVLFEPVPELQLQSVHTVDVTLDQQRNLV